MNYRVWESGCSEESCSIFKAESVEDAAELYAAEDCDGLSEGCYTPYHELLVRDDLDGRLFRVRVSVDYNPSFTAISSVEEVGTP